MILLPILALIVGLLIGFLLQAEIKSDFAPYVAVGVLAGIDSLLGGTRSALEERFRTDVFVTGFFSNIAVAFFLAWLGDKIGVNLYLAAVLILGWRIFTNLSLIRRHALTKWNDKRQRKRAEMELAERTPETQ